MTRRFYSNGKLLLAGEYVILDGALGLAVPTKFGQSLQASSIHSPQLRWTSLDEKGEIWFESSFTLEHYEPIESSDRETADTLSRILCAAKKGNPRFLETGHQVETRLGFSRNWGLGSSSTLINNIAQWAEIDAHELLWNSFSGSGYDISCAQHSHPIFYQLKKRAPIVAKATFDPTF
ncbi:MAG: GYDIA family GHMP kinase, partial [Bacteroidota bacterium]